MTKQQTDILISGGGIAGLSAAALFGAAGFSVICVDPAPAMPNAQDPLADLRSTAFLQPAQQTLVDAGLWDKLAPHATPLEIMRLVDAGGAEANIRHVADFDASEISDGPFGWNLPNWRVRHVIADHIAQIPNVEFRTGTKTDHITARLKSAIARLSDGTMIEAKCVIAADGRNSPIRENFNVTAKTTTFDQKAMVFSVTHTLPHKNVSIEVHRTGGPFTLVPLPDRSGCHQSSVVWMDTNQNVAALTKMSDEEFNAAINQRSCGVLGTLKLVGARKSWPIISRLASSFIAPRTALVAEASHVVPPIGAQGLNMSLTDIQTLVDLARADPSTIGDTAMLESYQKKRYRDVQLHALAIDALNRAAMTNSENLRALRLKGLQFLHQTTPIRRGLMHAGLGVYKATGV